MRRRRARIALPLALLVVSACRGAEPAPRSLVLVVVDTLRADHLSVYGHARPTTPALERRAREAAVFEQARSTSSWTLPGFGSLFTGEPPARHLAGRREEMPILLEFWAEAVRDPDLRDLYNRIYGGMRAAWLGLISDGDGPGAPGPADAAVLVGAVSGIFVQWLADPVAFRLEDAIDAVFAIADRPREPPAAC